MRAAVSNSVVFDRRKTDGCTGIDPSVLAAL